MRYFVPPVLLILLTAIQATIGYQILLIGGRPNFVLILVLVLAIELGSTHGMVWGLLGGFCLDLSAAGLLGSSALALIPIGLIAGLGARPTYQVQLVRPLLFAPPLTVLYYAVHYLIQRILGTEIALADSLLQIVMPAAILNLLFIPLFYIPTHLILRRRQPAVQW